MNEKFKNFSSLPTTYGYLRYIENKKQSIGGTGNSLEEKLINHLMWDGKKSQAQKIVKDAHYFLIKSYFQTISDKDQSKSYKSPSFNQLLLKAMDYAAPPIVLRSRRQGSRKLQIPFPLRREQRYSTGLRWIVAESRRKAGLSKHTKKFHLLNFGNHSLIGYILALTVWETSIGKGEVVKRTKNLSEEIQKNRGNSYLRWLVILHKKKY